MNKVDLWEIIGDGLIIVFGIILIYIFITIDVLGYYGVEDNAIIKNIELYMGMPIIALGIWHLIRDLRNMRS